MLGAVSITTTIRPPRAAPSGSGCATARITASPARSAITSETSQRQKSSRRRRSSRTRRQMRFEGTITG